MQEGFYYNSKTNFTSPQCFLIISNSCLFLFMVCNVLGYFFLPNLRSFKFKKISFAVYKGVSHPALMELVFPYFAFKPFS